MLTECARAGGQVANGGAHAAAARAGVRDGHSAPHAGGRYSGPQHHRLQHEQSQPAIQDGGVAAQVPDAVRHPILQHLVAGITDHHRREELCMPAVPTLIS